MSTFTTPLQIEPIGKWKFKLLTPFEYHIGKYPADNKNIIRVPTHFVTDFASIPRIFWAILSPMDEYAKAAVLHDWLYYTGKFSKKETEKIFREAMNVIKTPKWKIFFVYWAVYYFGFMAWNKHRKDRKKGVGNIIV